MRSVRPASLCRIRVGVYIDGVHNLYYGDDLDSEQKACGAALHVARSVLAARTPFSSSTADAVDLVMVARWILDGHDP